MISQQGKSRKRRIHALFGREEHELRAILDLSDSPASDSSNPVRPRYHHHTSSASRPTNRQRSQRPSTPVKATTVSSACRAASPTSEPVRKRPRTVKDSAPPAAWPHPDEDEPPPCRPRTGLRTVSSSSSRAPTGAAPSAKRRSRPDRALAVPLDVDAAALSGIEKFARLVGTPDSAVLKRLRMRKVDGRVSLAALEGCNRLRAISLVCYITSLCAAYAGAMRAYTAGLQAYAVNGESASACPSAEQATVPLPSEADWRDELLRRAPDCVRAGTVAPPMVRSLRDLVGLLRRVFTEQGVAHEAASGELYLDREADAMATFVDFCGAYSDVVCCHKTHWPREKIEAAIAQSFEAMLSVVKDVIAYETGRGLPSRSAILETLHNEGEYSLLALNRLCSMNPTGRLREHLSQSTRNIHPNRGKHGRCTYLCSILQALLLHVPNQLGAMRSPFEEFVRVSVSAASERGSIILVDEGLYESYINAREEFIHELTQSRVFWTAVLEPFVKRIKKSSKSRTAVGCLLNSSAFTKALVKEDNEDSRDLLLREIVTSLFAPFAQEPVAELKTTSRAFLALGRRVSSSGDDKSWLTQITTVQALHEMEVPDMLAALLQYAILQREIIANKDADIQITFMAAFDKLLHRVQLFTPLVFRADDAELYASTADYRRRKPHSFTFSSEQSGSKKSSRSSSFGSSQSAEQAKMELEVQKLSQNRVLAITAKIVGSFCKSFETGQWNPDHACTLQKMLSTKFRGKRNLGSLYQRLVNVQHAVERRYEAESGYKDNDMLSILESNRLMIAIDTVRRKLLDSSIDRFAVKGSALRTAKGADSNDKADGASGEGSSVAPLVFPKVDELPEVQAVVSSQAQWLDFGTQAGPMKSLQRILEEQGSELLARFDVTCEADAKWTKPRGKRNQYAPEARALLDSTDMVQPSVCDCMKGNVSSSVGGTSKIGCSNDSCKNRQVKIECNQKSCPAKGYCQNQRMQRMQYAKVERVRKEDKGSGIIAVEDITAGDLVGEYQGEVIDHAEFLRRKTAYRGERHFYFMTLTSKLYIDASRVAQITRFINHSCEPNAETVKWNAGGEPRVGIFAVKRIPKGEEITFDYGVRSAPAYDEPVKCLCKAKTCKGFLVKPLFGTKLQQAAEAPSEPGCELPKLSEAKIREEKIAEAKALLKKATLLGEEMKRNAAPDMQDCLAENGEKRLNLWKQQLETYRANRVDLFGTVPAVDALPSMNVDVGGSFRIPKKSADSTIRIPSPTVSRVSRPSGPPHGTSVRSSLDRPEARSRVHRDEQGVGHYKAERRPEPISRVFRREPERKLSGLAASRQPVSGKKRKSMFAPLRREKKRLPPGSLAPVIRNRKIEPPRPSDWSDHESCDGLSLASPTVPVDDADVLVPEAWLTGGDGESESENECDSNRALERRRMMGQMQGDSRYAGHHTGNGKHSMYQQHSLASVPEYGQVHARQDVARDDGHLRAGTYGPRVTAAGPHMFNEPRQGESRQSAAMKWERKNQSTEAEHMGVSRAPTTRHACRREDPYALTSAPAEEVPRPVRDRVLPAVGERARYEVHRNPHVDQVPQDAGSGRDAFQAQPESREYAPGLQMQYTRDPSRGALRAPKRAGSLAGDANETTRVEPVSGMRVLTPGREVAVQADVKPDLRNVLVGRSVEGSDMPHAS